MDQKKVNFDLNQRERGVVLQGLQYVTINTFKVHLGVTKFWPFLLYFMRIFGWEWEMKIFQKSHFYSLFMIDA